MAIFPLYEHKHRYRIVSTTKRVMEERMVRFQCRLCYENYETYPDRLWRPNKLVFLSESNISKWAPMTDYEEQELRQTYQDAMTAGCRGVALNMVRQLDGSWHCEPFFRGETRVPRLKKGAK